LERRALAYWIATGIFCTGVGFSGLAHTAKLEPIVEAMTNLGYPVYFMTIIGMAKLFGVVALLSPGRPLLKEWAYAGFTFNLIGATASHAFAGDPLSHTIRPALLLLVCAASYLLRPTERRLPSAPAHAPASRSPRVIEEDLSEG
jgi:hypothetical protein